MRSWLMLLIVVNVNTVFCQPTNYIKAINQVIAPTFHVSESDTINCGFFDNYQQNRKCGCVKEVGVGMGKPSFLIAVANGETCPSKIFVFSRTKSQLKLIDSSASFCFGKGCNVEVRKDSIILNSLIHHAGYSLIYVFNSFKQKYYLQKIKYFEVSYSQGHYFENEQTYTLRTQQLLFKSIYDQFTSTGLWEKPKEKKKIVKITLPKDLKLKMSDFVDPNEVASIYDKIFISSGKLYKDMNHF